MTSVRRETVAERVEERGLESYDVGPAHVVSKPAVEVEPSGRRRWHVLSSIGRWPFVLPATALAAAAAAGRGRRREAWQLAAGVTLAGVASNFVLKPLVKDARPEGALPIEFGYGFPSGHASAALALGALAPRALLRHPLARAGGFAAGLAFAVAMGVARVRVTAHDWEDVWGGWMLGALAAGAVTRAR